MSDSIITVSEFDAARIVVTGGRPTLQLGVQRKSGAMAWIPVTASLSMSKPKDGKAGLPFANLCVGGEQMRFMPEVASAITGSAARVDSEVSAI